MGIVELIFIIALLGVLTWVVITYVPMPAPFRTLLVVVVILLLILWILNLVGVTGPMVPRVR